MILNQVPEIFACYMCTWHPRPTDQVFWCWDTVWPSKLTCIFCTAGCVQSYVPVLQYISDLWDFCRLNVSHTLCKLCYPVQPQVEIKPWRLTDSDFIMDHTQPIDARKTIFIGGVSRTLKACELAELFNSQFGNVCYAGIDCDLKMKYPKGMWYVFLIHWPSLLLYWQQKEFTYLFCFNPLCIYIGSGRVTFASKVSFMSAVSCRFFHVTYGDIDKEVCKCESMYRYTYMAFVWWPLVTACSVVVVLM